MTPTQGGYRCRYGCGFAAVVLSMTNDHEAECPMRPTTTEDM